MAYTTLQEFNQTGVEGLMRYTAEVVPIFWNLILFAFFLIVLFGTYLKTKSDFVGSLAVASILTSIFAFILGMIGGLIPSLTMVICFVISIVAVILLLTTDR